MRVTSDSRPLSNISCKPCSSRCCWAFIFTSPLFGPPVRNYSDRACCLYIPTKGQTKFNQNKAVCRLCTGCQCKNRPVGTPLHRAAEVCCTCLELRRLVCSINGRSHAIRSKGDNRKETRLSGVFCWIASL